MGTSYACVDFDWQRGERTMLAIHAPRKTAMAVACTILLPLALPAAATPTFICPGVRYIGNSSVTIPDTQNTAGSCTTVTDGAIVAADATFNAVTGFFLAGWTLTTDVFGHLMRVTNAAGITWNLGLMPGHLTTVGTTPGQITQFQYDAEGRVVSTSAPGGVVTQYSYNGLSESVHSIDRAGITTTYTYDAQNRPVSLIDSSAGPNQVSYTYSSLGIGPSGVVESPSGRTTSYTYDAANQMVTRNDPQGPNTTSYSYDPGTGNLTQSLDTLPSRLTRYTYDSNGNVIQVEVTDDPPPPPDPVITSYQYDAANNLIAVARDGTII